MRSSVATIVLVAACSTAPLDGQNASFDTFASVTESASTGGDPSTTGEGPTTGDPSDPTNPSDPSDPTVEPESTGTPTTEPGDSSSGAAESTGAEESTGDTSVVEESSSSGAMTGPMEESSSEDSGPDPLACVDEDLGTATGDGVASGSNAGATDDLAISCASGGGADAVFLWTAPAAGTYTFDLSGSNYDTALGIFDPDCGGAQQVCNDDAIGLTSSITIDLAANEAVLVSVEGYNGATGNYVLDINAGAGVDFSCADGGDLGSATGDVAMGTTVGASDDWSASCASEGADVAYGWTAPAAGSYTFSLVGSSYDTVITLQSPDCGGSEVACNDDAVGLQSEVSRNFAAGETVIVVVDGYSANSGNYTLAID